LLKDVSAHRLEFGRCGDVQGEEAEIDKSSGANRL
jgi:hypothetical protein